MSEPARSNGSQPLLNAEWLRQPEVVELVQHMAAFAAALMGHLNPSVDNNVAGNVPGAAPGMAGQLPDGSMPSTPSQHFYQADGHELDRYLADQARRVKDTELEGNHPDRNIGEWQSLNRITTDAEREYQRIAREKLAEQPDGRLVIGPNGQPIVVDGGPPSHAPGAPVATANPDGANFEAHNTKLKGDGGARLME